MDIGTMDTPTRVKVGLKPRATGLPWIVWLQRRIAGHEITIELTETVDAAEEDAATFLLEPELLQVKGPDFDFQDIDLLASWVRLNMDMIEGYWDWTIGSGREAVEKCKKTAIRW